MNNVFEALKDETRRRILMLLLEASEDEAGDGWLPAGTIHESVGRIGKPTLSYHLRLLDALQLVKSRRRGLQNVYTLNPETFQAAASWFAAFAAKPKRPRIRKGA